jgi:hypothetical protein
MTISSLLFRFRAEGGDIRERPTGNIEVKRGRVREERWKRWRKILSGEYSRVLVELREERASRYWEESGYDYGWWRSYPYSTTPVAPACTCKRYPLPHYHKRPGPPVNCELLPGEDAFSVLSELVKERVQ